MEIIHFLVKKRKGTCINFYRRYELDSKLKKVVNRSSYDCNLIRKNNNNTNNIIPITDNPIPKIHAKNHLSVKQ